MGYDVAVLGADGRPAKESSLSINEHSSVLNLAFAKSLPMVCRMSELYEEVAFSPSEVMELRLELLQMLATADDAASGDRSIAIRALIDVCDYATMNGSGIVTLPD